jgi:hypothetical protein
MYSYIFLFLLQKLEPPLELASPAKLDYHKDSNEGGFGSRILSTPYKASPCPRW